MEKGQEVITLKITKEAFEELYNMGLIDLDEKEYKISRVEPHDVEYEDDPVWKELKKESNNAYKKLKEHEFKLRHDTDNRL
jgi:hypothetical protein